MFLEKIKEKNKLPFLKLCVNAALCNGRFEEQQRRMIQSYCQEMYTPEIIPEQSPIEDIIEQLYINASNAEKNIIILKILNLVKLDGGYDEEEKKFMTLITKALGVRHEKLAKLDSLLEIYNAVYKEITKTIVEE